MSCVDFESELNHGIFYFLYHSEMIKSMYFLNLLHTTCGLFMGKSFFNPFWHNKEDWLTDLKNARQKM